MDEIFTTMFSMQPDEIIRGDYFYHLPYHEEWVAAVLKQAENLFFNEREWIEHRFESTYKPRWAGATIHGSYQTDWYEPWMGNIKAIEIINKIASDGKPFMDIASSESMGLAPYIVKLNPKTPCLVTDIDRAAIKILRSFINGYLPEYNINLASFDNLQIPLKDNSLDTITSRYGISSSSGIIPLNGSKIDTYNYSADRENPTNEVYRVLKPGGRFITLEMDIECDFDLQKIYDYYNKIGNIFGIYTYDEMQAILELLVDKPWRNTFKSAGFEVEFEKKYYKKYSLGQVLSFLHGFSGYHSIKHFLGRTWREHQQAENPVWSYYDEAEKAEHNGIDFYGVDVFFILRKPESVQNILWECPANRVKGADIPMEAKKEIGYCGLACMLCSSREGCPGCGDCSVAKCAAEQSPDGCYACPEYDACEEEMPHGKRSRAFNRYAREFGKQALIERLSANVDNGITYHKPDKTAGDYDALETEDEIMRLIQFGRDDPYVKCPIFDTEHFTVRLIEENDAEDLLICYCDPDVQRIFNKDGCPPAPEWANEMPSIIRGWLNKDYANGYFIRFSVVDKQSGKAIGTMEVFDKKYKTERTTGILRLDIASAYEKAQYLTELFNTANAIFFDVFHSKIILHQAFPELTERTAALTETGFRPVKLRGHKHYWANEKEPANISLSQDPYDRCPVLENENILLRLVAPEDAEDLLPCYSQPTDSVTTNSFGCITGEGGYGTQTLDGMKKFIHFWLDDYANDYANRHFVRWSVVDKRTRKAIGTIELFSNPSENVFFNNNGILRLDLLAAYERTDAIDDILSLLLPDAFEIFGCAKMTTKVSPSAAERIAALQAHGFKPTDERLVRQDGVYFDGFWALEKGI